MIEYNTLDAWFKGKDRGDGRKFSYEDWALENSWFEPIFRDVLGQWCGLGNSGLATRYFSEGNWREWHPPKVKKKIKMYMAIICDLDQPEKYFTHNVYTSKKCLDINKKHYKIVGWQEIEAEIDE